jgi:cytochrome c-type biogenesis protein CcmH
MRVLVTALCLLFGGIGQAFAVMPDEVLTDANLEARARIISKELRCMVCQNQSIDDSDAQLAKDLRVIVRERLVAGDSDDQILEFVEARYGAFVLLKPRFNAQTVLLWSSPLLLVAAGIILIWRRKMAVGASEAAALTPDEEARIESLLRDYKS